MKDSDILLLYNRRDERAIRETQRKYEDYCMSISMGILYNRQDAEECVNDTYLHAWRSIPPKQPSVLKTYLGKLTRNLSIDKLRTVKRAKRNADMVVSLEEIGDVLTATEALEEGELLTLLESFLDELPETDARIFVGRYWYGYSVTKLAKGYGMKPNAVSKLLARTRERLRIYLNERGYAV